MALQQCAVREDLAAGRAGRALWPVRAHVHVERALLRETLGTDSALEGTHSRVCDHMLEQVVAQRERSPAHGALVGLLPCGRHGVRRTQGQLGRNPKCLCPASPPRPTINPESPAQQGPSSTLGPLHHSRTLLPNKGPHTWPGVSPHLRPAVTSPSRPLSLYQDTVVSVSHLQQGTSLQGTSPVWDTIAHWN